MPSSPLQPGSMPAQASPAPQWHWQPWGADERARPDGAWAAAHAWLGALPGAPAAEPPLPLPLRRDAHGRPRFRAGAGADAGWSHSGDGLLIAFMRGAILGVDMEVERARPKALEIARRHFAPAEADWLEAHGGGARDHAFLRLWCAKEAVLKAHGRGLAFGLDRLVFAERDGALVLVDADPRLGEPAAWSLREFVPHPGYRAVLAWRPTTMA